MAVSTEAVLRHRRRLGAPAIVRREHRHRIVLATDLIGIGVAMSATAEYIRFPGTRGYVAVLATVSLLLWFLCVSWPPASPFGGRRYLPTVISPFAAALATYGLATILDARHPTDGTIAFAVIWGAWLFVVRLALGRGRRPIRVLLTGSSVAKEDLVGTTDLVLEHVIDPPDEFRYDVAVTDPAVGYDRDWQRWFVHAELAGVRVMRAASLVEAVTGRVPTASLSGRWAPEVFRADGPYPPWKRLFDAVGTVLLLPVLLLLASLVAVVVLVDSGRPVLFWQERAGLRGTPFRMVKFRTMIPVSEVTPAMFATSGDPRITRVGAWLRRFRLDELPQFWNVLRGEMSVVGPRPEQRAFVTQFSTTIPLYDIRLQVRPGITGWAQVTHGYADSEGQTREKLRRDLYYIKHLSPATDARILLRTMRTILTGFGSR